MAKDLSGCVNCMRGLLLILNVIFLLLGIALLGIGIYVKVDTNFASTLSDLAGQTGNFSAQSLGFLGYMMIIAGVITILIALFGCVGALWHNRCLLWTYAIILLGLMILELTGCIMAIVYKGKLRDVYDDTLSTALKDGLAKNNTDILGAFKALEETLDCCGVHNITDYGNYPLDKLSKPCQKSNDTMGCADKIIDILDKNLPIISGTLGGILALELFTLLGAIALAVALKHAPEKQYSSNPREVIGYMVPGRRRDYR